MPHTRRLLVSNLNNPIAIQNFNEKYKNRTRKKIYVTPSSELSIEDRTLVDIVFNNSIPPGGVLPKDVENKLRRIENNAYQISYHKTLSMYNVRLLIMTAGDSIRFIIDTDGSYDERSYKVIMVTSEPAYIDTALSRAEYLIGSSECRESTVLQYNAALAPAYKILFKILFFTEVEDLIDDINTTRMYLETLLKDTEVTLHLTANRSVMLYGSVDNSGVVTLNVREISTPDTYYTRTFALGSLYV